MANKTVLGKGLSSLLPSGAVSAGKPSLESNNEEKNTVLSNTMPTKHMGISLVSVKDIKLNPNQPRKKFHDESLKELSESIKANGIIQPLVVQKKEGEYQLIAGERRLRASKIAGLVKVPVVIRQTTDRESIELAIIENIQREDLNCVDQAQAYFQLQDEFFLSQDEIAKKVGKDRATISNFLRLLRLSPEILKDLRNEKLTHGHAKALLAIEDPVLRLKCKNKIIEKKLSVRETELMTKKLTPKDKKDKNKLNDRLLNLSYELTRYWATKVEVRGSLTKGSVNIHYNNGESLDRIVNALQKANVWQKSKI